MISENARAIIGVPDYYTDEVNSTPMKNFWAILSPLAEIVAPRSICEIGSERGLTSAMLADRFPQSRVHVVDPIVHESVRQRPNVTAHQTTSLAFFHAGGEADLYLVDGDHNYETVHAELEAVRRARKDDHATCVVLHDVGWPFAYRDGYYSPEKVASPHPFRYDTALVLEHENFSDRGWENGRSFALAEMAGGARNGVLRAVLDFQQANPEWSFRSQPLFYGLGILWHAPSLSPQQAAAMDHLMESVDRLRPMLAIAEVNRLRLLQALDETRAESAKRLADIRAWQRNPLRMLARAMLGRGS